MFEISVKKSFRAVHSVADRKGNKEPPHEHDWVCEASLSSTTIDHAGFVADFRIVDEAMGALLRELEGADLNAAPLLLSKSPTAENVAFHIYLFLTKHINVSGVSVERVKVWEDEFHSAAYHR